MRLFLTREVEFAVAPSAIRVRRTYEDSLKSCHNGCIELALDRLRQTNARHLAWHRVAIGPLRRHRVVRIGDRNDPRKKRDLVANEIVRVATTIDSFVVMPNDASDVGVVLDIGKNPLSDNGVLLHLATLVKSKGPWLLEEPRRKANFSDVMDKAAEMSQELLLFVQADARGDIPSVDRNSG